MTEQIEPCPRCKSECAVVSHPNIGKWVLCLGGNCEASSPAQETRSQAIAAHNRVAKPVPDTDKEIAHLIQQRDHAQDMADKLATVIANVSGEDFGEHTSANCPWENALQIDIKKPVLERVPMLDGEGNYKKEFKTGEPVLTDVGFVRWTDTPFEGTGWFHCLADGKRYYRFVQYEGNVPVEASPSLAIQGIQAAEELQS